MGWLLAIIVGGVSGWLASVITGSSNGALVNILLGIVGGLVGAWRLGLLDIFPRENLLGVIVTSVVGAIFIILIARLFTGGRSTRDV